MARGFIVALDYALREKKFLHGIKDGASKVGDGKPWTPQITVKGGTSGFYTLRLSAHLY